MESSYAYKVVMQKMSVSFSSLLLVFYTLHFYHAILAFMSSGLHLPLQLLPHNLPISSTGFPPHSLALVILLPKTFHSPPPSLGQHLITLPFQLRHHLHLQLSNKTPKEISACLLYTCHARTGNGHFLNGIQIMAQCNYKETATP